MPARVAAFTSTLSTPTEPSVMTLQRPQLGDDVGADRDALGVDGVRIARGFDEGGLLGRRLDDLGLDAGKLGQRLHLVVIAAAGRGEAGALRRDDPELGHVLLPPRGCRKPSMGYARRKG
jgi:hypothetical protein